MFQDTFKNFQNFYLYGGGLSVVFYLLIFLVLKTFSIRIDYDSKYGFDRFCHYEGKFLIMKERVRQYLGFKLPYFIWHLDGGAMS